MRETVTRRPPLQPFGPFAKTCPEKVAPGPGTLGLSERLIDVLTVRLCSLAVATAAEPTTRHATRPTTIKIVLFCISRSLLRLTGLSSPPGSSEKIVEIG